MRTGDDRTPHGAFAHICAAKKLTANGKRQTANGKRQTKLGVLRAREDSNFRPLAS
jgi:hypothetical protein